MIKSTCITVFICLVLANSNCQDILLFEFGPGHSSGNRTYITEAVKYNSELAYGFDFENTEQVAVFAHEASKTGYCTAKHPFYFSARVPEGNYEIRVLTGNPESSSHITIKAEARRLLLPEYRLEKGESKEFIFTVSVRSPHITGTDSIRLKPREYNYMNWDDRLSLEFSGVNHAVQSIEIRPAAKLTTLYLAGNSTVTDQDREPWASWGQMITAYFDTEICVANFAESGESLSSFKSRKRLDKVMTLMQPGDYLFIEFGHNDQKRKGEGIGPWTSFSGLLKEFISLTREKGAHPILLTPTQRRSFNTSGTIDYTHGDYPAAMRKVAEEMNVPLIDLNEMTKVLYEAWGPEASKKAFVHYPAGTYPGQDKELKDNTHFNAFGANEIALCILKGIIEHNIDLAEHIQGSLCDYNPAKPNEASKWKIPASPRYVSRKPDGN